MNKRKVIAIDLDGTLCNEVCFTEEEAKNATPNESMIEKANKHSDEGAFVVVYTARRDHLIPASLDWLRRNGIRFHAVSNNKMPADMYIDDKAVGIDS